MQDSLHFAADQGHALRNAMDLGWLRLIDEVDKDGLWVHDSTPTFEAWVCVRYGFTMEAARDEVMCARKIASLPKITEAYSDGLLSKQKLIVLCSFVETEEDEYWSREATAYSVSYLRRVARYKRRIKKEEAEAIDERREFSMWWNHTRDVLSFSGRLPGSDGTVFEKAIRRLTEHPAAGPMGEWIPIEERLADALVLLAATKLGEDKDTARANVVVHVDARDLNHVNGTAFMEDGPLVPSEVARRLACDGYVQTIIHGADGEVVGIGRRSRIIPQGLERAVRSLQQECACCGTTFLAGSEIHHIIPWARGGPTDLPNLTVVCKRCHRLIHERNYQLFRYSDGRIGVRKQLGQVMLNRPTPLRPDIKARMIGPPNRKVSVRM